MDVKILLISHKTAPVLLSREIERIESLGDVDDVIAHFFEAFDLRREPYQDADVDEVENHVSQSTTC